MSDDQAREPFNFLSAAVDDATESLESQLSAYREALVEVRDILNGAGRSTAADDISDALSKIDSALGTEGK